MEDDLKIPKVEYLRNLCMDFPQNWNLNSADLNKRKEIEIGWNEDNLEWKTTLKSKKLDISEASGFSSKFKLKLMGH